MEQTAKDLLTKLSAPFTKMVGGKSYPDIKWLPKDGKSMKGKIICMPYLSGGQVRDRLNEVLGVDGWMFKSHLENDGSRTGTLSIRIGDAWVDRDGVGTKSNQEAEKGADTDALKRAARNFGIGAYLEKLGHRYVNTVEGNNGKPIPVDSKGRKLYGKNLHDFLNGMSSEQGLLYEILVINPKAWEMDEFKTVYNKFNI